MVFVLLTVAASALIAVPLVGAYLLVADIKARLANLRARRANTAAIHDVIDKEKRS